MANVRPHEDEKRRALCSRSAFAKCVASCKRFSTKSRWSSLGPSGRGSHGPCAPCPRVQTRKFYVSILNAPMHGREQSRSAGGKKTRRKFTIMKPPVAPLAGLARGHGLARPIGPSNMHVRVPSPVAAVLFRWRSVAHDFAACPAPLPSIRESVSFSRFDVSPHQHQPTLSPARPPARILPSFQVAGLQF